MQNNIDPEEILWVIGRYQSSNKLATGKTEIKDGSYIINNYKIPSLQCCEAFPPLQSTFTEDFNGISRKHSILSCITKDWILVSHDHKISYLWHRFHMMTYHPAFRIMHSDQWNAVTLTNSEKSNYVIVSIKDSGKLFIWRVSTGALMAISHAHSNPITKIIVTHDDRLCLSFSSSGEMKAWWISDLLSQRGIDGNFACKPHFCVQLEHQGHYPTDVWIGKIGKGMKCRFALSFSDSTCEIRQMSNGQCLAKIIFPFPVTAIFMDPLERILIAGGTTGQLAHVLVNQAISEHGSALVSLPSNSLISEHPATITTITMSMNSAYCIAGDSRGNITIWNTANWVVLKQITLSCYIEKIELFLENKNAITSNNLSVKAFSKSISPLEQRWQHISTSCIDESSHSRLEKFWNSLNIFY